MKNIYIITGGTLVHVSPHFSLCAPAYGNVGLDIYNRLHSVVVSQGLEQQYRIYLVKTKMAGRNSGETMAHLKELGIGSSLETNQDLSTLIRALTKQIEIVGLVMAAAICDFEPVELTASGNVGEVSMTRFGKDQKRLHHVHSLTLKLRPSTKIIDSVKRTRPDIHLVTFKTTAGAPENEMFSQALYNLERNKSDLVFANDIQNHRNIVVMPKGKKLQGKDRQATLDMLCEKLFKDIVQNTGRHA